MAIGMWSRTFGVDGHSKNKFKISFICFISNTFKLLFFMSNIFVFVMKK